MPIKAKKTSYIKQLVFRVAEKEGFDPVCGSLHSLRHLGSFIADRCTNSPSLPLPPAVVGFLPLAPVSRPTPLAGAPLRPT